MSLHDPYSLVSLSISQGTGPIKCNRPNAHMARCGRTPRRMLTHVAKRRAPAFLSYAVLYRAT